MVIGDGRALRSCGNENQKKKIRDFEIKRKVTRKSNKCSYMQFNKNSNSDNTLSFNEFTPENRNEETILRIKICQKQP